jgi:hypothetical protein
MRRGRINEGGKGKYLRGRRRMGEKIGWQEDGRKEDGRMRRRGEETERPEGRGGRREKFTKIF